MATYDVRIPEVKNYYEIQWGESDFIYLYENGLKVSDLNNDQILVEWDEVNNLIAALKKAQELWGNK